MTTNASRSRSAPAHAASGRSTRATASVSSSASTAASRPTAPPVPRGPLNGVTVREHVAYLLADSISIVRMVEDASLRPKMSPTLRATLQRELAGLVANAETLRAWLANGAPTAGGRYMTLPDKRQMLIDEGLPTDAFPHPPIEWC